ncbi:MAG TPA: response regulator [Burkholderiaceae bacterium]|nr:response regulator [Burkholderiaceae bacterium]
MNTEPQTGSAPRALAGRRILVVEDERILALELTHLLVGHGALVVGPATTVAQALTLISCEGPFDGAVLDLNLGGTIADAVADRLLACDVPILIVSGYGAGVVDDRFADVPRLEKPFDPVAAVELLVDPSGGERARRAGPAG